MPPNCDCPTGVRHKIVGKEAEGDESRAAPGHVDYSTGRYNNPQMAAEAGLSGAFGRSREQGGDGKGG